MITKRQLIKFEEDIKFLYENKKIKAPIHLSGNNEKNLIKIFKNIKSDDWVFQLGAIIIMLFLKEFQKNYLKKNNSRKKYGYNE